MLPPGNFNRMIPVPLCVYSYNFTTTAVSLIVFLQCCRGKIKNNHRDEHPGQIRSALPRGAGGGAKFRFLEVSSNEP